jgi:hypothetical protein
VRVVVARSCSVTFSDVDEDRYLGLSPLAGA